MCCVDTAAFIVINYDREETNGRDINKCDFLFFSRLPSAAARGNRFGILRIAGDFGDRVKLIELVF